MNRKVFSFIVVLTVLLLALSVSAFADGTLTAEIPVEIQLTGEGAAYAPVEDYTVELKAVTADAPMPAGASGGVYEESITGPGSLTLKMDFSGAGIGAYEYTLKQIPGSNSRCTYDATEYEFKVTVYVDEDNNDALAIATALRVKGEKDKLDEAVFKNEYPRLNRDKLDPPLKKQVETKSGTAPSDSEFTFKMTPDSKDAPMPDPPKSGVIVGSDNSQTMTVKGEGEFEFGWMYYEQEHVGKEYTYKVEELAPADSKYSRDTVIYYVHVVVTSDDEGNVVAIPSYTNGDGDNVDRMVFTNIYDNPPSPPPPPTPTPTPGPAPKTGDDTNWWPWMIALVLSGCTLVTDAVIRRRKNRGESGEN